MSGTMAESDDKKSAQPWHDELSRYKEVFKKWTERGEKVVKRYRDERKDVEATDARFNIFWSNVQTLKPAIYAKPPNPEVSRRFDDQNDIARVASTILERVLSYEITQYPDFHATISNVVDDRLLPGRGVAWVRYEPIIESVEAEPQITNYREIGGESLGGEDEYADTSESLDENALAGEAPEQFERITTETTPVDYVYWQDFAHLPARTWEEVTWVARRVYMSLEEGEERFGEVFSQVPLTHSPDRQDGEKETTKALKKAEIWEIWSKSEKCVYWIADNYDIVLDHRDDPLELTNFFPCPKPYFATTTSGSLVPIADFLLYQDQADEIDDLTGRIKHLTKAMKVMGIYAADEPAIERLMKEGNDGVLIPVKNWAAFVEKGGLQGAVQFMPLRDVAAALQQLYQARESCKQIIYETTGLSDIMRGASVASETATAQQIKSQFASLRLNTMKDDMSRFARDILRMKSEIICSKYQAETLVQISGIMYTPDAQFVQPAIEMLKNESMRNFNIDIETDTLVQIDQQTEKQNRIEFLTSVSGFLEKVLPMGQQAPELVPLMGEMLLFGIRGFKIGRTIEGSFEQYLSQVAQNEKAKAAQPPQPPPPTPEMIRAQAESQNAQAKIQLEQQTTQAKLQLEQAKLQTEQQLEAQKLQFEQWKAQLDADTRVMIAEMSSKTSLKQSSMTINAARDQEGILELNDNGDEQPNSALAGLIDAVNQNYAQMIQMSTMQNEVMLQKQAEMVANLSRPKQIVRGADGKIIGVQ
jgi:hypothetical protein